MKGVAELVAKIINAIVSPVKNNLMQCVLLNVFLILPTSICPFCFPEKRYWIFNFGFLYLFFLLDELLRTKGRIISNSAGEHFARTRKISRCIFSSFIIFISCVDIFLLVHFNAIINAYILQLIFATNLTESSEFIMTYVLSLKTLYSVLLMFGGVLISFLLYNIFKIIPVSPHPLIRWISSSAIAILCIFSVPKAIQLLQYFGPDYPRNWKDSYLTKNPLFSVVNACWQFVAQKQENQTVIEQCNDCAGSTTTVSNDSTKVVVIIGESFNKHHSSLYCYRLDTNPLLSKYSDLAIFTDVISCTNSTLHVLNNVFSCASLDEKTKWFERPLFPAVFKKAGFTVTFWSNQYTQDPNKSIWDDSCLNIDDISKLNFNKRNDRKFKYDEELYYDFVNNNTYGSNELNIFHLMGSHIQRKSRFPDSFTKYKPSDYPSTDHTNEQLQEIADYDNSILYNDYVIDKIICHYKETNAVIIYFSDHGEETYDFRNHLGRAFDFKEYNGQVLRNQVEVPFLIYMTEKYKSQHTDICNRVFSSVNRPFITDDIPHLLFELGGIKCKYYNPARNILDNAYDCNRMRFVLNPYTNELVNYDKYKGTPAVN